ncbi:MAG: phosphate regulon sensor histidine kinase PhoR [Betaproteobacteria bacterium]|nr:phosphate regulon sensor histidine kinase PhoR [Betaproteobacteria bacterium]MDE2047053.1 phosphate regulon sensor histidine kinase PhoR [Betaproteobacteria bacterium]
MWRNLPLLVAFAVAVALGHRLAGETGAVGGATLVVLAWVLWDSWQSQRLAQWLRQFDSPPDLGGFWGELQYRMYQRLRRSDALTQDERGRLERFLQAIQASPNGVALLDDEDKIEWANNQLAAHLGLDSERDRAQRITFLVRHPDFVAYLNSGQYNEPVVLQGLGAGSRSVQVQLFPFNDLHRAGNKLLLTRDVTEQQRTDVMRRDFVANVSHELKTPLTVLKGFLETLRSLPLTDAERERFMQLMNEQAERMQHLVDDLLVLAKLESDSRQPEQDRLDMRVVVDALKSQAQALSSGRHTIAANACPLHLLGSQSELMSAFSNLVSNAVRYTPAGGMIRIEWMPTEQGGAALVVHDTGVGVAPEHIPRLTERFYRVDRARSRENGGTGLGLAIVKHALQRHSAELRIESREGLGSTFSAVFPPARVVQPALPQAAEPLATSA